MRRPPVVYFARLLRTGRYKIGTSRNLERRIETLAGWYREGIAVVATMPGDHAVESSMHRRFAHLRDPRATHGAREIFVDDGSIAQFVSGLEVHGLTHLLIPLSRAESARRYATKVARKNLRTARAA